MSQNSLDSQEFSLIFPQIEWLQVSLISLCVSWIDQSFNVTKDEFVRLQDSLPQKIKEVWASLEWQLAKWDRSIDELLLEAIQGFPLAFGTTRTLLMELVPMQTFFLRYGLNFNDRNREYGVSQSRHTQWNVGADVTEIMDIRV